MNLESIVKKLFLGGTAAVAVAVSLMAAQSFAVSATGTSAANGVSSATKFSLTVDKVLTLESATVGAITALPGQVAKGNLAVKVQTNAGYTIKAKATSDANLVNTTDSTQKIAPSTTVNGSGNTWGIKTNGASAYSALSTSDLTLLDTATSAPAGLTSNFEIGVSTTPTLPEGTYQTSVTVTAAVK